VVHTTPSPPAPRRSQYTIICCGLPSPACSEPFALYHFICGGLKSPDFPLLHHVAHNIHSYAVACPLLQVTGRFVLYLMRWVVRARVHACRLPPPAPRRSSQYITIHNLHPPQIHVCLFYTAYTGLCTQGKQAARNNYL
jgi:hypothetical protein